MWRKTQNCFNCMSYTKFTYIYFVDHLMASSYVSDEESRYVVIGICLTKVLSPTLRKVVNTELQSWYSLLCKPPVEIDKQVFGTHKRTLPPSKTSLQYKNINGNNACKSPSA